MSRDKNCNIFDKLLSWLGSIWCSLKTECLFLKNFSLIDDRWFKMEIKRKKKKIRDDRNLQGVRTPAIRTCSLKMRTDGLSWREPPLPWYRGEARNSGLEPRATAGPELFTHTGFSEYTHTKQWLNQGVGRGVLRVFNELPVQWLTTAYYQLCYTAPRSKRVSRFARGSSSGGCNGGIEAGEAPLDCSTDTACKV